MDDTQTNVRLTGFLALENLFPRYHHVQIMSGDGGIHCSRFGFYTQSNDDEGHLGVDNGEPC